MENYIFMLIYFVLGVEGIYLTIFSNSSYPVASLISAFTFLFLGLGSFALTFLTKQFTRTYLLIISIFLMFILDFLMAYVRSFTMYAIFRWVIGFSMGVSFPLGF